MKMDQRKLSIILVIVYIILSLITAYSLFTFQDDLVYGVQALPTSKLDAASPVFLQLYVIVLLTLFGGLFILIYLFNNKSSEIIYVEKSDEADGNQSDADDKETEKTFDIDSIKAAVTAKTKSQEKLLTEGLTELCKKLDAGIGAFYMIKKDGDNRVLQMTATYAMSLGESQRPVYEVGEGLVGQVGAEGNPLILDSVPEGYIQIVSGLGSASPTHLMIVPVRYGKDIFGVVEIASFTKFSQAELTVVEQAFEIMASQMFDKQAPQEPTAKDAAKTAKKETGNKKEKE